MSRNVEGYELTTYTTVEPFLVVPHFDIVNMGSNKYFRFIHMCTKNSQMNHCSYVALHSSFILWRFKVKHAYLMYLSPTNTFTADSYHPTWYKMFWNHCIKTIYMQTGLMRKNVWKMRLKDDNCFLIGNDATTAFCGNILKKQYFFWAKSFSELDFWDFCQWKKVFLRKYRLVVYQL